MSSEQSWPKHVSATLTHNQHKNYYKTVAREIEDEGFGYDVSSWVSDEEMRKAIDTDECWTFQWYPETPVGFCVLSASTLDVLMAAAAVS